ncbi:metal-dependent hydrolase [Lysobacter enzymogenes]|uniref:metal-dependent hydrolase n=1 Tax=Lysobacter enzymogenes TaxID=69 RepID=UPI001AF839CC|nr:metal-dependent hydrolase [Lysobacter enzymogenes]QQQ00255.1 metal-dependent hydrolase [Lysobacter enzymogenes]
MDSLTQIVLGAALSAAIAPAQHRRAALLAGAALGTLPDLDVLPVNLLTGDPVARMTWHRSISHSLLVLPFVAWAIWGWCRGRGGRVAQSPKRWFWAMQAALLTHPVLDAFTVYGTQLWWPLPARPTMWSSIFIIDPLYTVWLLAACVWVWFARAGRSAQPALALGLALSSLYLGGSLWAKHRVEQAAQPALAALGLENAPRFSVPMPFTTALWRVVAMTPDGYVEGERSLLADRGPMHFRLYPSDSLAYSQVSGYPAVHRLQWFNHGFMKAEERDGRLVLSDLRMGAEPDYNFRFAVARREAGGWREIAPEQLQWPWDAAARLPAMWQRIWREPAPVPPEHTVADVRRLQRATPMRARAGIDARPGSGFSGEMSDDLGGGEAAAPR